MSSTRLAIAASRSATSSARRSGSSSRTCSSPAAYKERGALVRLSALTEDERKRGVIAMSAGNHAQGVSYHAGRLGIPATIVMPIGTPAVKAENTKRWGARDPGRRDAGGFGPLRACVWRRSTVSCSCIPSTIRSSYPARAPSAGKCSKPCRNSTSIIVPVGGGGLIAGIAVAAKAIKPSIEIIGVEAALYPSMYNVMKGTQLPARGDTLAEGIAVVHPGDIPARLVQEVRRRHRAGQRNRSRTGDVRVAHD